MDLSVRTRARALISVAALVGTVAVALPAAASAADQNLHDACGNTRNNFGFSDSLYNGLNNNGEGRVGPRRLVVNQSGRIVSRGTRLFVQRTPMDIGRATITIRKTDGRARTTVVICATEEGSAARQTRLTEFDIPRGNDRGTFTRALTGLRAMMDRNMLIDVDHLSWKAVDDAAALTRARSYYPLYAGHTRVNHLMTPAHKEVSPELNTPLKVFDYIRESGGIIGMRTGPEDMLFNAQSGVSGSCPGSVRSLIQTYRSIVDRGVPAAFGSDLNGFVTMTGPRFGPEGCPAAPAFNRLNYRLLQDPPPVEGRPPSWAKYEQRGLADISTEPSVIFDMKSLGVDTTSLENSTESFIRTWTRAYQPNRQRIAPPR